MPGPTPPASPWTTTERVCAHLGIGIRTLRALMRDTPADVEPPWVNVGASRRPTYRWRLADVDAWVRAVSAERGGGITGASPQATRPVRQRRAPPAPATGTNLKLLACELTGGRR